MFKKYLLFFAAFWLFASCGGPTPPVKEAPVLPTVTLGEAAIKDQMYPTFTTQGRTWLAVNLNLEYPASWCYNGKPENCKKYGRLYRWKSAKVACDELGNGWRLPTDEDWKDLVTGFGGYFDWLSDQAIGDPVAANRRLGAGEPAESRIGFHAHLGGWRGSGGGYDNIGKMGFYWSGTEREEELAWFYIFLPDGSKLNRRSTQKRMGMACRCVKDVAD